MILHTSEWWTLVMMRKTQMRNEIFSCSSRERQSQSNQRTPGRLWNRAVGWWILLARRASFPALAQLYPVNPHHCKATFCATMITHWSIVWQYTSFTLKVSAYIWRGTHCRYAHSSKLKDFLYISKTFSTIQLRFILSLSIVRLLHLERISSDFCKCCQSRPRRKLNYELYLLIFQRAIKM